MIVEPRKTLPINSAEKIVTIEVPMVLDQYNNRLIDEYTFYKLRVIQLEKQLETLEMIKKLVN